MARGRAVTHLWLLIAGLASPFLLTGAPPAGAAACLAGAGALLLALPRLRRSIRRGGCPGVVPAVSPAACARQGVALALLAAAASTWQVEQGLAMRLERPLPDAWVEGRVVSLPSRRDGDLRFLLLAEPAPWGGAGARRRLEVRWFDAPVTPAVGERWRLPLRIRPPRGRINFIGPDRERFAFHDRIHASARVAKEGASRLAPAHGLSPDRWREVARSRLVERLGGLPGEGLVRALTLGDRDGLSDALRAAMRGTGTGHLLAISGLHVGLVAGFGTVLARIVLALALWRDPRWPARRLALTAGLAIAAGYALLAGFGTSPRRAIVMTAVAVLALLLRRRVGPWRTWAVALLAVLVFDPLSPLGTGFWLSFVAVFLLIFLFAGRAARRRPFADLLRAQGGLMLGLLPLGLFAFQWVSVSALPANLVAIPWVSFVTLPLSLLAVVTLPFDGLLPEVLAGMAERSATLVEAALVAAQDRLHAASGAWPAPSSAALLLAFGGALLCLLPGALRLRRFGLLLLLPLVLPTAPLVPGGVQLDVLDVGQGQAALLRTAHHALLVDTGPGMPGGWDRVRETVLPALVAARATPPDLVLVSHGDLDHAGGLATLRTLWPDLAATGNRRRPSPGLPPCHTGRAWRWDDVGFSVLHPGRWLPYLGNDSSCVLAVRAPGGALLLPGDVGRHVERRLARDPAGPFRVLLAPHHGSDSSSSLDFIDWARPEWAVFSNGYANRFGFPRRAVLERFRQRGVGVTGTAACGGLRFRLEPDGRLRFQAARRERSGFWRLPAAPHCPPRGGVTAARALTSPDAFRYHAGHSVNNLESRE